MTKKRKPKAINREDRSPLMKLKLNQSIKTTESLLSGDELEAFKKLPPAEKRDVVVTVLQKAVDTQFIDYFKQLNADDTTRST